MSPKAKSNKDQSSKIQPVRTAERSARSGKFTTKKKSHEKSLVFTKYQGKVYSSFEPLSVAAKKKPQFHSKNIKKRRAAAGHLLLGLVSPGKKVTEKKMDVHGIEPIEFESMLPTEALIDFLEDGFSSSIFTKLCTLLELPEKELTRLIRLPVSTLWRRKEKGYFTTTESERLLRILKLYHKAVNVFDNNPKYAKKWLKEEAYGLNGHIPLEYARTEVGAREVDLLLTRIDEGIFA